MEIDRPVLSATELQPTKCTFHRCIDFVDIATRSSARGLQLHYTASRGFVSFLVDTTSSLRMSSLIMLNASVNTPGGSFYTVIYSNVTGKSLAVLRGSINESINNEWMNVNFDRSRDQTLSRCMRMITRRHYRQTPPPSDAIHRQTSYKLLALAIPVCQRHGCHHGRSAVMTSQTPVNRHTHTHRTTISKQVKRSKIPIMHC